MKNEHLGLEDRIERANILRDEYGELPACRACPTCGLLKAANQDLCPGCQADYGDYSDWPEWVLEMVKPCRKETRREKLHPESAYDDEMDKFAVYDTHFEEEQTETFELPDGKFDDEIDTTEAADAWYSTARAADD